MLLSLWACGVLALPRLPTTCLPTPLQLQTHLLGVPPSLATLQSVMQVSLNTIVLGCMHKDVPVEEVMVVLLGLFLAHFLERSLATRWARQPLFPC